jgi:hypothetical protein
VSKSYRRKNQIAGQFSARTIEMMESPAFRVLDLNARRVLDRLEIEHAHHAGQDNGQLVCTYDHFIEYGIRRNSVAPAIRVAEALGFIEITERGRAGNAEFRRPHKFRLNYRHTGRANPTDEWRRIKTMEEAETAAKLAKTPRKKTKTPVSLLRSFQYRKRYRKTQIHSNESDTTSHSNESDTTSRFSGREPNGRLPVSELPPSKPAPMCWAPPRVVEVTDPT